MIVYELFVSKIVTQSYNCLEMIIIIGFLKLFFSVWEIKTNFTIK